MMRNLLQDTLEAIKNSNHISDDIIFIGRDKLGKQFSFEDFRLLADKNYDLRSSSLEVLHNLRIVFSDNNWLELCECNGAPMWKYVTLF